MKSPIAAMALCGCLAGGSAGAQTRPAGAPPEPPMPTAPSPSRRPMPTPPPRPTSRRSIRPHATLPGPTPDEELKAADDRPAQRADRALSPDQGERSVHGDGQGRSAGPTPSGWPWRSARSCARSTACRPTSCGPRTSRCSSNIRGTPAHGPQRDHEGRDQDAREGSGPTTRPPSWSATRRPGRRPRCLLHKVKKIKPKCLEAHAAALPLAGGPDCTGDPDDQSVRPGPASLPARRPTSWSSR